MSIDLKALGFTQEELQKRVVDQLCEQLLTEEAYLDPESDDTTLVASAFGKNIQALVKNKIDETVASLAERFVLPNVSQYIENLVLQETNRWGEKTGESVTFIEYLVQRADAYMREDVDYQGKSRAEAGDYSWSKSQTRIAHLIDSHLQYSIKTAMANALQQVNSSIASGLNETVKIKLAEVLNGLKVEVRTK